MKKILLACIAICVVTCSYTNAATIESPAIATTTETQPTYESLTLSQQQFIDGFINSLYYKMNYQTDAYYVQDIINDLTKLKAKQPKLKDIITVTIDRLKSNYATDLATLEDQNDGLDPIRSITTDKKYIMSKKQFIKSFKEKALSRINNYGGEQDKQSIATQMKNHVNSLSSGALTTEEEKDLIKDIEKASNPNKKDLDYSTVISAVDSTYPQYQTTSVSEVSFVNGTVTDADLVYTISSNQVEYTGAVVLDLFANNIYRLNSSINLNTSPETTIKSTIANGTIIKVIASITNNGSSVQMIPSGTIILKDSKGFQHNGGYYSSSSYGIIKPQETIRIPYYFIIEKGASVEYVVYQGPFTIAQGIHLIETK